jgi:uncharacterized membrane protein
MKTTPSLRVREVELARPLVWLQRGLADLLRCPVPGLLHGLASAAFGALLLWWAHDDFWILAGTFSGFLIVAPIVATGLYVVSWELERGRQPTMSDVLRLWRAHDPRLVHFGVLLAFAGTGWVVTSAAFVTSFADQPIHRPIQFLRYVVLQDTGYVFEVWLMLGALLAAPMFASTVIAIPVLLERKVSVLRAIVTSWNAVLASPSTMAAWAAIILGLTVLGMLTALVGLIIVVPWLAHASWHAYRDIVLPDD